MKKIIKSTVYMVDKEVDSVHEVLNNTGNYELEKPINKGVFTKDVISLLLKHNMIDMEDDKVEIYIKVNE